MDVRFVTLDRVEDHAAGDLRALLSRTDGFVWVDIPVCDDAALPVLREVFGFHEMAVHDCTIRNHVAKIHAYRDHVFTVLHAPEPGDRGHVHYVELDQFLGPNYLVTVHGPLSPAVEQRVAEIDTSAALARMRAGHLPASSFELSAQIVRSLARREIDLIAQLAQRCGELEQKVIGSVGDPEDAEGFLNELFRVWYELLAIRTIALHSSATYDRVARLSRFLTPEVTLTVADLADGFDMVVSMADGQREFLHGVIEYFQTRMSTHLAISSDDTAQTSVRQNDDMRKISAWVAIVAVPTAVTGFFGQNVPYPGYGTPAGFIGSSAVMVVAAVVLYVFFRRRKWL